MVERDGVVREWKDRYADLQKAHDSLKKQVDSMNRYFEDLPTSDDHSKKVAGNINYSCRLVLKFAICSSTKRAVSSNIDSNDF